MCVGGVMPSLLEDQLENWYQREDLSVEPCFGLSFKGSSLNLKEGS